MALIQAGRRSAWDLFFRTLTVAAILAALALAFWSLFWVWFPVQKQSQELTGRVSQ